MLAAQVTQHGKPLEINSIPTPQASVGQVLVKIELSGVCHTDVHVQEGDWKVKCPLPMTPGHEGVGTVVQLGSGVINWKIGDRVCVPWLHGCCGQCEHCWAGWETVCGEQTRTGFSAPGTFAEYCLADASFIVRVPERLPSAQAAIVSCAGLTVYKGLKVSGVRPSQWVVIVGGAGGLGHLAIQYAKVMGMKTIGVDCSAEKCRFMMDIGCDAVADAREPNLRERVLAITGGGGAHGALILAPVSAAIGEAVKYMRPRGTIIVIGLPPGDLRADIFDVVLNAITIRGSIVGTRLDLQEALQIAADGKIEPKVQVRRFQELQEVIDDIKHARIDGAAIVTIR